MNYRANFKDIAPLSSLRVRAMTNEAAAGEAAAIDGYNFLKTNTRARAECL